MPFKAAIPSRTKVSTVTNDTTSGIEIIDDTIIAGLANFLPLNKTSPIPKTNSPTTISISAITDVSHYIHVHYTARGVHPHLNFACTR